MQNPNAIHDRAIDQAAKIADELSRPSVFQLAAGEMTASERRCVAAVATLIARRIRELKTTALRSKRTKETGAIGLTYG